MTKRFRLASGLLIVLGIAATLPGCGIVPICTLELRYSVIVEVRDAETGRAAARGVTGRSEHESGIITEFSASGDLRLDGDWDEELPGNHTILVRKPGHLTDIVHADVDADRCHVDPETVEAELAPDPRAVADHPASFIEGPDPAGWRQASAEVRIRGDTLAIEGFARTGCTELRVVAFRSGSGLHVQFEPSDVPLDDCVNSRWFEARFLLPSGRTDLLVTNAVGFPAELFDGQVRPAEEG